MILQKKIWKNEIKQHRETKVFLLLNKLLIYINRMEIIDIITRKNFAKHGMTRV